ncbi:MAG: AAA family ATPase [Blastochloris viridis]|uniref:AAA family ATPase n=1 Tax=Blastochloris viridis TaxID=1079 RepID=A0A6N4RAB0_BLAVI|nr:MAG: AAA family ATPase [Blastochloris viridis]
MQRVMIIGISGAGKSTLGRALSSKLKAPAYHLDNIYHLPGWVARPDADVQADFDAIAATEAWVVDGNYRRLSGALQERADAIIFLDFGRVFALRQVIQRWAFHRLGLRKRVDLGEGFSEKLSKGFLPWVWNWRRNNRPKWMETLKNHSNKVKTFHNRRDAYRWLETL